MWQLPNSGSNRDRWQHDLFASGAAGYGGLSQDAPYEDGNRSNGGTNLLISNLDFGVSDGDIKVSIVGSTLFNCVGIVDSISVASKFSISSAKTVFKHSICRDIVGIYSPL